MTILFLTHVNMMDGANRSMLQLVEELRTNHGVRPIIVCPSNRPDSSFSLRQACKERGIECHALPLVFFKQHGSRSVLYRLRFLASMVKWNLYMAFQLRHVRFDLVHSNSSVIDMGAYLAWFRHVPHVWHLREFGNEDFGMNSVLGEKYEKWIYGKSTCAIAISKAIESKFNVFFSGRICQIYNGIMPVEESLCADHRNDTLTFCMVGRLEPNKNQMEALQALALVKSRTQRPFRLLLVGKPSSIGYMDTLRQFIVSNGLENDVEFMAYRSDIPQFLKRCDVGLTLSTCEAFGRVTVEYMMQNLAVIVSNTGANTEIVADGKTGLVYQLGVVEQLADRMCQLIENRPLLTELAANGRHYALSHFTSCQNSDAVNDLYDTLLK